MVRRRLGVVVALAVLAALAGAGSGARAQTQAVAVSPPDLRILVPSDLISIGLDASGRRELRFTHVTTDFGPGPFEIDPHYQARSGVSTFSQALYRRDGHGGWRLARRVPLAAYGTWEPPSDYRFPLTSFTLNRIGAGGAVGAVVARSPKVDYCITGDTQVSGIRGSPAQTFIPDSNCGDPTLPLGWSVGWGDQYDQTDAGQPIPLAGVADGTYVLRATVDPRHALHELTTANDVTDTTLRIAGDRVAVLAQKVVSLPLPRVRLVGVRAGETVAGSLALRARVAVPRGHAFRSLQFLLDGKPLGPRLTTRPWSYPWTVAAAAGTHYLSARVTDSQGLEGSAPVVRITVRRVAAVHVTALSWHAGLLRLRMRPLAGLRAALVVPTLSPRPVAVRNGRADVRCRRPARVVLELLAAGRVVERLVLPLGAHPAVRLVNPGRGETVSGIVPLAAQASDSVGVTSVRFLVDGRPVGPPMTRAPYRVEWDTRKAKAGPHVIGVLAVDAAGHATLERVRVQVSNPAPPMTCFVLQHHGFAHGASPVSVGAFSTVGAGETLLALVSADGPQSGRQSATVSGGGLQWKLVAREDASPGDAEIWEAVAARPASLSDVTATLAVPGYDEALSVVAMEGADGAGASAAAAGSGGAPHLSLTTLSATSLVFAVGNDWDRALARQLPVGWVFLDQLLNAQTGDTFWSQYTNQPTGAAGSTVPVTDTQPTGDHWNLAAVELVNSGA